MTALSSALALGFLGHAWAGPTDDARTAVNNDVQTAIDNDVRTAIDNRNYRIIAQLARPAAEQGDATAQYYLGWLYLSGFGTPRDTALAALWFRRAAEQGNRNAQNDLAFMYARGDGVPQDDRQGLFWLDKATSRARPFAQQMYRKLYDYERARYDHGVEKNSSAKP
jgi:TPR repeat protein